MGLMPMGMQNSRHSPMTHPKQGSKTTYKQKKETNNLIGKICHIYLNNLIIWSNMLEDINRNVTLVLGHFNKLTLLFPLGNPHYPPQNRGPGHHIWGGIKANQSNVICILKNWAVPKSAKQLLPIPLDWSITLLHYCHSS